MDETTAQLGLSLVPDYGATLISAPIAALDAVLATMTVHLAMLGQLGAEIGSVAPLPVRSTPAQPSLVDTLPGALPDRAPGAAPIAAADGPLRAAAPEQPGAAAPGGPFAARDALERVQLRAKQQTRSGLSSVTFAAPATAAGSGRAATAATAPVDILPVGGAGRAGVDVAGVPASSRLSTVLGVLSRRLQGKAAAGNFTQVAFPSISMAPASVSPAEQAFDAVENTRLDLGSLVRGGFVGRARDGSAGAAGPQGSMDDARQIDRPVAPTDGQNVTRAGDLGRTERLGAARRLDPDQLAGPDEGDSASSGSSGGGGGGDVYLDGMRVGRWLARQMGRDAARPPASGVGFDARVTPGWIGGAS